MDFNTLNDRAILNEIGDRIRRYRLNQNTTQERLARKAGVSRTLIQYIETGKGGTLVGLIAILRALGMLDQFDALLPNPGPSPIQLARLEGSVRQRATGRRANRKGN
jgi:transcriptional regulator with XRE-family HTH domain